MNVKEIAIEYLKANGYDGLYNSDAPCACRPPDLFHCCGEGVDECEVGHLIEYPDRDCGCGNGCDWHIGEGRQ